MLSASVRTSLTSLTRRRARAGFSVLTLAIAVASVSFFAIPPLIDRAMQEEVRAGRLADVTLSLRPVELSDERLERIAALPNVAAVEARSRVDVRLLVGERRAPAQVIGVRDFARQGVDIVRVTAGRFPGEGELLADVQDANVGVFDGRAGDRLTVVSAADERVPFVLSGRGRSLPGGEQVQDTNVIVLYAPAAAVAALSGERGASELALALQDPSADAAQTTVDAVRDELADVPGFAGFSDLPSVRAPGDWPGKADTETFAKLLGVITVLALGSAVVLISNTMSTLVAEQTREIAVMRAVGARRRQVRAVYLRTAVVMGVAGAVTGLALGVLLSNVLATYFASMYWAVDVPFGVVSAVALVSGVLGVVVPPLAALPAIRRGLRADLRDALHASGSALGAERGLDRLVRRLSFPPRAVQLGLRNVGRRKRRSLATALIVAVAVGNLLAVLAMAAAATSSTARAWGDHLEDAQVSTGGRALFDERAEREIRSIPGLAEAQPVLKNTVAVAGREAFVWGVAREQLLRYRLAAGRWFSDDEQQAGQPVAVVERNIAQITGIRLGDEITVTTAAGDAELRVVGLAKNQQEDGTALYVPLTTARKILDRPSGASAYWVRMEPADPASVERTTTAVEDRLAALGYEVTSEITHIAKRDEITANRSLTTTIAVLGFAIVAMSMVGLANAITTNVLERTREIGILRSIGARSRDVRRIFTTEGLALAVGGWLAGIPLGYALTRVLIRLVWEIIDVRLPVRFPPVNILIAFAGTVILALTVLWLPVRRAVHFRPGDALRYT